MSYTYNTPCRWYNNDRHNDIDMFHWDTPPPAPDNFHLEDKAYPRGLSALYKHYIGNWDPVIWGPIYK